MGDQLTRLHNNIGATIGAAWLGALLVAAPQGAFAQDDAVPATDDASSEETVEERFVITATRTEKAIDEQAGNTARLNTSDIEFAHADHAAEILNRLPGVFIHRGNGQEHLTSIRSPVLTGGAGAGSFLYLENGVPLRAAGFANVNGLFEAHTEIAGAMEVVRGPGSSLYGSNAVHGLINVVTRSGQGTTGFGEIIGGSFGRYRLNGWASAETNDGEGSQKFLVGGTLLHEDGYRDDAGLDQVKLSARHQGDVRDWNIDTVIAFTQLNQETAGFVRGVNAYRDRDLSQTNPNPEAFRDATAFRISSRWERNLSPTMSLALTPFARVNEMEFLMHFLPPKPLEESGHHSVGLLSALYWDVNDVEIIVGADGEWTSGFMQETQDVASFGSFPQGVHYDYEIDATVLAAYVHGEWQMTDWLRFVAGARLEHTRYEYDNLTATDTVGRYQRVADRNDDFTSLTPRLGAVADINEAWSAYVNLARGARAPQTTDLYRLQANQTVGDIEEEELDSIEVGLRREAGGSYFEIAGFWMEKENFFFRDADGFNVSDGRTRHRGIEVELYLPVTPWFDVAASGTYAEHTYRFTNPVNSNSTESILSGDDVDTAPRTLGNLRLIFYPLETVQTEVELVHVGDYFTDASNAHDYPGHNVINLRASWEPLEQLEIFVALRNAADVRYAERADFAFGSERYFPGEPRAVEVGVRRRF